MLLIDLFGYSLPAVKISDVFVFIAFLFAIIIATIWIRLGGESFRRFVYRTFTDASGQPEAKLLTAFLFSLIQTFLCVRGAIFNSWPPESLYDANLFFISLLLGLDTTNTIFKRNGVKTS
jgi:hypothetical protein